jgi:hypothetical protein
MAQTPTTTGQALPSDAIARGQEIYDQLMREIEPELTNDVLPTLKEKYANETPEQATERQARYEAAFAEYDKRYAQYMNDMANKIHTFQRTVRAGIESDERTAEQGQLSSLESTISTL